MSKLIKYPEFSPLPPCTDAANVVENIQNWINRREEDKLKLYCRPDNSDIGYRFVEEEDFLETKEEEQTILQRKVRIVFTRYAEVKSIAWYPLHFTTRMITAQVYYNGKVHNYKNDNQLKLFFKERS
jgi:hypothetical protein